MSHFSSVLKVLLLPEIFPVYTSGKLPTGTATLSFLDCICRLMSETITSIIFNIFFPTIFQKRAQQFSVIKVMGQCFPAYITNSFNQYSCEPTILGSRHSKLFCLTGNYSIINFCKTFFFHMTGTHV